MKFPRRGVLNLIYRNTPNNATGKLTAKANRTSGSTNQRFGGEEGRGKAPLPAFLFALNLGSMRLCGKKSSIF
jgi:hypothetical protein